MNNGKNYDLEIAIIRTGRKKKSIAKQAGIHPSRLSQLIQNDPEPREKEKEMLSKVLDKPVEELFK